MRANTAAVSCPAAGSSIWHRAHAAHVSTNRHDLRPLPYILLFGIIGISGRTWNTASGSDPLRSCCVAKKALPRHEAPHAYSAAKLLP